MGLLPLFLSLRRSSTKVISVTEVIEVTEADQIREPRESIPRSLICALVANAGRQKKMVEAKADSRSKARRENPL